MTWKEFKEWAEKNGARDSDTINAIDILGPSFPDHPPSIHINWDDEDDGTERDIDIW